MLASQLYNYTIHKPHHKHMSLMEWNARQGLSKDPQSRCWMFVVSTTHIPQSTFSNYKDNYLDKIKFHSMVIDMKVEFIHSCLVGYIYFKTHPRSSFIKHILGYPAFVQPIHNPQPQKPYIFEDFWLSSLSNKARRLYLSSLND